MDINDNQQINTFIKGMNTDVSDALMDSSQYRYAENIRLVTNTDSNSGEVRLIEGVDSYDWDVRDTYLPSRPEDPDDPENENFETIYPTSNIKAVTSIRNLLVVIDHKDNIWVRDVSITEDTPQGPRWRQVFQAAGNEGFGEHLSLVTRWETPNLVKLYIADGEHQLMYINLMEETPIAGIDNIIANPTIFLGKINASKSAIGGTLGPVKVQYAFRRYKEGGTATTLSALSNIVTLYKKSNEGYTIEDQITDKAVDLDIIFNANDDILIELKNMQIYRLTYSQVGQQPSVSLIYDGEAVNHWTDVGQNVEDLSFTELLELIKMDIIPKVIESKEDYLFAANVTYNQDQLNSKISDEDCRAYSTGDGNNPTYSSYNQQFDSYNIHTYNSSYWKKPNDNSTIGGEGVIFSWEFITNDVYIDVKNHKYVEKNGSFVQTEDQLCSLRQGEVYRYGAVFYDERGNKTTAKWIADIMIPLQDPPEFYSQKINDEFCYKMKQIGIKITVNNPAALKDAGWSGVEIVRAVRKTSDRITITTGIGGYPYKLCKSDDTGDNQLSASHIHDVGSICSTGYFATNVFVADSTYAKEDNNPDLDANAAITDPTYLMFASPEYVYSPDTVKSLFDTYNNQLRIDFKYINSTCGSVVDSQGNTIDISSIPNPEPQNNPNTNNLRGCFIYGSEEDLDNGILGSLQGVYTTVLSPDIRANHGFWFGVWSSKYNNDNTVSSGEVNFEHSNTRDFISQQNYNYFDESSYPICWTYNLDSALENYNCAQNYLPVGARMINERVYSDKLINNLSLCNPYAYTIQNASETPIDIKAVAFSDVPDYNTFFDANSVRAIHDDIIPVGQYYSYIKWSAPLLNNVADVKALMQNEDGFGPYRNYWESYNAAAIAFNSTMLFTGSLLLSLTNGFLLYNIWKELFQKDPIRPVEKRFPVFYPTGINGRCIVMKLGAPGRVSGSSILKFPTIDIRRKNALPYGGRQFVNQQNYVSYGNIIDIHNNKTYIDIFDGDCYPGVFVYNAAHAWYEPNTPGGIRQVTVYVVPLESDVDLSATYGELFTTSEDENRHYIQDKASVINTTLFTYTQGKDAYWYHPAYGAITNGLQYSTVEQNSIESDGIDVRVHHSQLKTNGESIDNWLDFRPNNFIDVDTRFGEITNMRLFKTQLLYWQDRAVGILGVNERSIVNDIDDNKIVLGTGDVLQRFDYISTVYGMKPNQYEAEIQSNTTQYWWDGYNKEILAYSGGTELVPLVKVKNLTNYINNNNEVSNPSLSYDVKYNELMSNVVNGGTLTYNEQVQQFTSIYTFSPIFRAVVGNTLYLTSEDTIYRWNNSEDPTKAVLFDNVGYTNAKPKIQYVVNKANTYNKVFDITTFGGRFYGGGAEAIQANDALDNLTFKFDTPLKQHSQDTGRHFITNREYDFRLDIPRAGYDDNGTWKTAAYGDRMRGKTMQCELSSSSNSTDFSLQYIVTKYRMSWS